LRLDQDHRRSTPNQASRPRASQLDVYLRRRRLQLDPGAKHYGSHDLTAARTAYRTVHSALIAPQPGAQITRTTTSVANHAVAGRFFNSLLEVPKLKFSIVVAAVAVLTVSPLSS